MSGKVLIRIIQQLIYHGLESFGKYYSIYRGYVANVDDPENMGRLQILVPEIYGSQLYEHWAFPRNMYGGKGYGSKVLPEKGDVVWVTFEGGNPEVPIWEHGYFGKDEIDEADFKREKDCYWFQTPKGNLVQIYDTKNLIYVRNANGKAFMINEQAVSLISEKISLGSEDVSDEPAVLATTLEGMMKDFVKDIGKLGAIPVPGASPTSTISNSPQWGAFKNKWDNEWKKFKSKTVTLNK